MLRAPLAALRYRPPDVLLMLEAARFKLLAADGE
jgi:hypothetical protein